MVTIWFLLTLNFVLPRVMPGDPISALVAGSSRSADDETTAALSRYYGLDRPVLVQYASYLGNLAQGDLGVSIRDRVPVAELVAERLPWTLLLAGTAMVLSLVVGLAAGVQSGWRRGRLIDRALLTVSSVVAAFPVFFVASAILLLFAVTLGWVPLGGAESAFSSASGLARGADIAHHLALPASVMALQLSAYNYLLMRGGMVSQLGSGYLLLGRAKGLADRRLKYRYAARNALLPVVTQTALQLAGTVTVAIVFVESAFAYPGMGRLLFDAVAARDYPVLQGCFLVLTVMTVSLNFMAERLYGRLDPRAAQ